MTLTAEKILELESKGFRRWTKGNFDRLYINPRELGLELTYYKTGNIHSAYLNGEHISNCEARRLLDAKTYIDVTTGKLHGTRETLLELVRDLLGIEENEVA